MSPSSSIASSHSPSASSSHSSSLSDRGETELPNAPYTVDSDDNGFDEGSSYIYFPELFYDGAAEAGPSRAATSSAPIDLESHVAKRTDYRTVRIEAPDRQPLVTMYLRRPAQKGKQKGDKATAKAYKVELDGPAVAICPVTPAPLEMVSAGDDTLACIEVGLMHGDDPKKFKATVGGAAGTGAQPVLTQTEIYNKAEPRGSDMMRVFVKRTQLISTTAPKFFAGCLPGSDGRLEMRLVSADSVYFYPEIWAKVDMFDVNTRVNQRVSKPALAKACRELAAINTDKVPAQVVAITRDRTEKLLASKPFAVTKQEHSVSLLVLLLSVYETTQDTSYLDAMEALIEENNPDLRFRRATKTQGANAFMAFPEALSDEDALNLVQELEATFPHMNVPNVELLKRIHVVLCNPVDDESDGICIGHELQMRGLGNFLEICETLLSSKGPLSDTDFKDKILEVLAINKINMRHTRIETFRPPIDDKKWEKDEQMAESDKGKGKGLSQDEMRHLFSALSKILDDVHLAAVRCAEAHVEQHGGLLQHAFMEALLGQVAHTVDVESMKHLIKQVAAFSTNALRTSHRDHIAILGEISNLLNAVREARLPEKEK